MENPPPLKDRKRSSNFVIRMSKKYSKENENGFTFEPNLLIKFYDQSYINFNIASNETNVRLNNDDIMTILKMKIEGFENDERKSSADKRIKKENVLLLKDSPPVRRGKQEEDEEDSNSSGKRRGRALTAEAVLSNETTSIKRVNTTIKEYFLNQSIFKEINALRYRESVFRAASKLSKEMPSYPVWSYKDEEKRSLKISKINVGGEIFEIFTKTLNNLSRTKIWKLFHTSDAKYIPFVDRDPVCFNSILNFYRTGRLHVPTNTCLTFFEEELEFWGVHEDFIESCCWGDFWTSKAASNKLKKYTEDSERNLKYERLGTSCMQNFQLQLFQIMTSGTGSVLSRWVALFCALFIIFGILAMIFSTASIGRLDPITNLRSAIKANESVTKYLSRTKIDPVIEEFDYIASGFFLSELLLRIILSPVKLEFFHDVFNWIDLVATITSLLSHVVVKENKYRKLEAFTIILKLPRIFRLLKLTANLRSGIDAFVLTLFASIKELQFVFFILLMVSVLFGCIIFSVEMTDSQSKIYSLYIGIWWAIETLPGVGYGDYVPITTYGRVVGAVCIMSGVIICQMPVPVFLKNFSVYYNQASARLKSQSDILLCENVDRKYLAKMEKKIEEKRLLKKKNSKTFINKIF